MLAPLPLPAQTASSSSSSSGYSFNSDKGIFGAFFNGRLHVDHASVDQSSLDDRAPVNDLSVRRAYLGASGHLSSALFKVLVDVKGPVDAKEVWLAWQLGGGTLRVGHIRPAYGMEMMTSSNEILFVERQFISKDTLMAGRGYQNGVSYQIFRDGLGMVASVYSPNPAQDSEPFAAFTAARGFAARTYFAPLDSDFSTVHVGFGYDAAQYARPGDGLSIKAFPVARSEPAFQLLGGDQYDRQRTLLLEFGGRFGRVLTQGEYAQAKYDGVDQAHVIDAYYLQGSFFLTGETKTYASRRGRFRAPTHYEHPLGALELKARFAQIDSWDRIDVADLREISAGFNYYHSPRLRFLFDYNLGEIRFSDSPQDEPWAVIGRAQWVF